MLKYRHKSTALGTVLDVLFEPSPNGVGSFLCFINMLKYKHKSTALGTVLKVNV